MIRLLSGCLFLCGLGAGCFLLLSIPSGPQIVVGSSRVNLGVVPTGTELRLSLPVNNGGSDDLELQHIQSTCSCTVGTISRNPIQPGEEGRIDVRIETPGAEGEFTQTLTMTSNDPSSPSVLVDFAGDARDVVVPEVSHVRFGKITRGKDGKLEKVGLKRAYFSENLHAADFEVVAGEGFEGRVVEDSQGELTLELYTTDRVAAGKEKGSVLVCLKNRNDVCTRLFASVEVVDRFACVPSVVFLGVIRSGQESQVSVELLGISADDDVRVLPIPASISKSISASIVSDGKRRSIAVRVHPVVGARTIAGSITIEVLSPSEPPQRVVLPIRGVLDSTG